MQGKRLDPRLLAITAVMTAIVFVLTRVIQIPTPAKGYIHLGDAGVFFGAFAFGPFAGAIAGGLGTALADAAGGYPQWAIFSFLIHGLQGLVVGWLYRKWPMAWGPMSSADASGDYPQWAILSSLNNDLLDRVVGWLYRRWPMLRGLISWAIVGSVIVVVGYLFAGMILSGVAAALAEVPLNIIQVAAGAVVAVPLFVAVRQAYPPITRLGRPN